MRKLELFICALVPLLTRTGGGGVDGGGGAGEPKWLTYTFSAPVFQVLWDADERHVIVGARNALLKFDEDLSLMQRGKTGPVLDNGRCPPSPLPCDRARERTDNDVKVMLFFDQHVMLVCGTANQGMCHIYNINNVTGRAIPVGHPNQTSSYVAGRSTVVAFFSTNPSGDRALYSAVSYDGRPPELTDYSVSSKIFLRDTSGSRGSALVFDYSHHSDRAVTAVRVDPQFRSYVKYVYGFGHGGFVYFVLTQRQGEETYETRLARVCESDPNFFSYSEVTLRCLKQSALVYNLATAAHLGGISQTLRLARGVENEEKVLYVAFGQSGHGDVPSERRGSVLCMFPMTQLEGAFTNATRECFGGGPGGARRIKTILGTDTKCEKKVNRQSRMPRTQVTQTGTDCYTSSFAT